ncbi:hypothetical protein EV702DRAFT_1047180 [Suillus placidus]|uniref:Uncharacterized protein n=1 Tax=Suillus placidus TaxID=48579 RepID=A0A9P6ZRT1_9AGAM|nr:hypothetical protein EV702DRAFT_1047180 [Suillus placidus]
MAPLLTRLSARQFTLPNGIGNGDLMVVLDMLRAYLEHDTHLRFGTAAGRATPVGRTPHCGTISLVGEDVPASPRTPAQPLPEGGHWINPRWAELMEEALWMGMETAKCQREWHDWNIIERKAKRTHHAASVPPGSQTMDLGEGSITTRTAPPSPRTPTPSSSRAAPTLPRTSTRMDIDEEEEGATSRLKTAGEDTGKNATRRKK